MHVRVERDVAAPRDHVWALLTDWRRQPEWMLDARDVEILTPQATGDGVTIRCPTRIVGFTVDDIMRVTAWQPPHRLEVVHLGRLIKGTGAFELDDLGDRTTRVVWWERIDPPLGRLGALGARIVARVWVAPLFRRSLANFAQLAESGH